MEIDIAKALGYKNVRDAISRHCRGVVKHDMGVVIMEREKMERILFKKKEILP